MLKKYINKMSFFITLNLGLLFTALGIAIFKTPNHFAFGGTSGISIILASLFPQWNVGTFMWFVNIILIILGFINEFREELPMEYAVELNRLLKLNMHNC
jgi:uncharacterized membrane-anchored protein YitT (DUF2179 family)